MNKPALISARIDNSSCLTFAINRGIAAYTVHADLLFLLALSKGRIKDGWP
jgi:hypothetical protein